MSESVVSWAAGLRTALARLDPAGLPGAECVALVEELAATEKACAAARVRLAARAASSAAHRASGFRDAADWLAAVSGSGAGTAKADLATAEALDACPRTRDAVVVGELSLAQAGEITAAEADRPGSEGALVALAKRSTLAALRDEARRRRLAAVDVEVLHARQRAARSVRHWRDELGMVCGRFALPPEVGVPFVHRLEAGTDRVRRSARRQGSVEAREAHAADAFAELVGVAAGGSDAADPAEGAEGADEAAAVEGAGRGVDAAEGAEGVRGDGAGGQAGGRGAGRGGAAAGCGGRPGGGVRPAGLAAGARPCR